MKIPECEILTHKKCAVAVIKFHEKMEVLSSAVYNGGEGLTDCIFIMQVPKNFTHDDPSSYAYDACKGLSLPEDSVGFMTAAEVRYVFSCKTEEFEGMTSFAAVTAGLSNQVIAGDVLEDWERRSKLSRKRSNALHAGTINIVGLSSVPLSQAGKINILIAMTEAKTAALASFGYEETGTTSDAIAIVSPVGEQRADYSGTGTPLGISMARAVKHGVKESLVKRGDNVHGNYLDILAEAGISKESIVESIIQYLKINLNKTDILAETLNELSENKDIAILAQMAVSYDRALNKIINENNLDDISIKYNVSCDIASCLKTKAYESVTGQTGINGHGMIYNQDLPMEMQAGDILKGIIEGLAEGISVSKNLKNESEGEVSK